MMKRNYLLKCILLIVVFTSATANAQNKVYATLSGVSSDSHVDNKTRAADGQLSTAASVKAYSGVLGFGGAYSGSVNLQFSTTLQPNTTSYVKIGTQDNILAPLVGGSLGTLLNDVLDVLLTGSQQFTVEAINTATSTTVLTGRTDVANDFAGDKLRIAQNAAGEYFIVISPDAAYNRIRLTSRLGVAIALGVTKRLDVYEAFYVDNSATCGMGTLTSYSGSGITLQLLEAGTAGVKNANYAIDSNLTNFSELGLGTLGIAASIQQTVYFEGPASATDKYYVRLSIPQSLVAAGLLNNLTLTAHKGNTQIGQPLGISTLLNADLLGLIQTGAIVSVPFTPGSAADRITIRYSGLAEINVAQSIKLYGIVKDNLSVSITGGGSYQVGANVNLVSQVTGCSSPYTYLWSQGAATANITAPTATPGTTDYTLTVTDVYGITARATAQVIVEQPPVGGTVTGSQGVCPGTVPSALTLTGYTGSIVRWERSANSDFSSVVTIANTTATLSGAEIGAINETAYFRAIVSSGSYANKLSEPATITAKRSTWNGTEWSNGLPDITTNIYFTGNYSTGQNLNGCRCEVSNNAVVSIPSGYTVTINGEVNILSGSFTLQNNANLIQLTNAVNTGEISVKRQTNPLYLLDYTMWSSPVTGTQTLKSFSPQTVNNRFYVYNTAIDDFVSNSTGAINPLTDTFGKAKGYLIRIGANHPAYVNNTIPGTIWEGTFTGVPNNGTVTFNLSADTNGYNLVGNPYPSPISIMQFMADNSNVIDGIVYIWRKKNDTSTPQHYISVNVAGVYVGNGEPGTETDPLGIIRQGQGFWVKVKQGAAGTTLNFTNAMRRSNTSNQFFRMNNTSEMPERHGFWLNLSSNDKFISQMYGGYIAGATDGQDNGIDAPFLKDMAAVLASGIGEDKYMMQGKALPFNHDDVYKLIFKTAQQNTYTITLDRTEGELSSTNIYIRDNYAGVVHNLTDVPYVFDSAAGDFTDRFEIIYQNIPLSITDIGKANNALVVWQENNTVNINAGNENIKDVKIYDIRGRQLHTQKGDGPKLTITEMSLTGNIMIVEIKTDKNTYNRKIVSSN